VASCNYDLVLWFSKQSTDVLDCCKFNILLLLNGALTLSDSCPARYKYLNEWTQKGTKCYWVKKQLEPFCNHPLFRFCKSLQRRILYNMIQPLNWDRSDTNSFCPNLENWHCLGPLSKHWYYISRIWDFSISTQLTFNNCNGYFTSSIRLWLLWND